MAVHCVSLFASFWWNLWEGNELFCSFLLALRLTSLLWALLYCTAVTYCIWHNESFCLCRTARLTICYRVVRFITSSILMFCQFDTLYKYNCSSALSHSGQFFLSECLLVRDGFLKSKVCFCAVTLAILSCIWVHHNVVLKVSSLCFDSVLSYFLYDFHNNNN